MTGRNIAYLYVYKTTKNRHIICVYPLVKRYIMGMYDTVRAGCLYCDDEVEWQSKAGECILSVYCLGVDVVPIEILEDIKGEIGFCSGCDATLIFDYDG